VHNKLPKLLGKPLYKYLHPEFLLHFQKQWEDTFMILANTLWTLLKKIKIDEVAEKSPQQQLKVT
jgi:hypothetical protein